MPQVCVTTTVKGTPTDTRTSTNNATGLLTPSNHKCFKAGALVLLVVQGGVLPLLIRYTRIRPYSTQRYLTTTIVFLAEVLKLVICIAVVCVQERSCHRCFLAIYDAIFRAPTETLKVCIPSIIYAIQNNLYFIGLSNLDAATFSVTYQFKIVTTALFYVCMLKRPQSAVQWFALVVLAIGVAVVQIEQVLTPQSSGGVQQNRMLGFAVVLTICISSGFAGVYYEKILKDSPISIWIQNVRLGLLGIPLSFGLMLSKDLDVMLREGLLVGYDRYVWSMVLLSAAGGLLIAMVVKYANNILKSYAQGVAVVASCVGSNLAFGFVLTMNFVAGMFLVVLSIVLYARFPPTVTELQTDGVQTSAHEKVRSLA